jgi:outer membrane autotransporter protein
VAGVAAARGGNRIGVTGAAPLANIAGQKYIGVAYYGGFSENQVEAAAIGFQGQENPLVKFSLTDGAFAPVRVMNHSYGPEVTFIPYEAEDIVRQALKASSEMGVLHVYSAGNNGIEAGGRLPAFDSDKKLALSNPYAITVAALGSDGKHSAYTSFGANVMVTAPSGDVSQPNLYSIPTTDRTGLDGYNNISVPIDDPFFPFDGVGDHFDYYSQFDGTSSSAPLVSGIMALGVQANPNMDIRMARHLIARTSLKVDPQGEGWTSNAKGYDFNPYYGYGMIDADAFTLAAANVRSLSQPSEYLSQKVIVDQGFSPEVKRLTRQFNYSGTGDLPLEYVQLKMTVYGMQTDKVAYKQGIGSITGDLQVMLTSPSGVKSVVCYSDIDFADTYLDNLRFETQAGYNVLVEEGSWNFLSNAFFGESATGNWTIDLHNYSTNTNYSTDTNNNKYGVWDSFQLTFGMGDIDIAPLEIGAEGIVTDFALAKTVRLDVNMTADQKFRAIDGKLTISGNVDNRGHQLTADATQAIELNGRLSGSGALAKSGKGLLMLAGDNTDFTGQTTISDGALVPRVPTALGLGSLVLGAPTPQTDQAPMLVVPSKQKLGGNLAIGGDFHWNAGEIAFYASGASPQSGDLAIGIGGDLVVSTSGNATFDFSRVESLDFGTYTLISANNIADFGSLAFQANYRPDTTLIGNFTTSNKTVLYTITGAQSTGGAIDNSAGTLAISEFIVDRDGVVTIGSSNTLEALAFRNRGSLAIQTGSQLVVSSGNVSVQSGASVISGGSLVTPGNFSKSGSGELVVQSNLVVNGTAAVETGLLSVNGNLVASNVVVSQNATLGGAGTIFSNVNVNGGNLAPGNSPGTLTIAGNLVLTGANSTTIEIASPTNFDRIVVGGQATLGGALNIEAFGGNTLAYGQQYNILQAGSITENFTSITAPETFRGRLLNGGTVGTILIAPDTYSRVAVTPNQFQVAKALDRFIPATSGDQLVISTALDLQAAEQYPTAFDQIMPGFYESLTNIAIGQAFFQTQMLNQHISSVRLGAAGFQAIGGISQPLVNDKNGKSAVDAKDASPILESTTATNWNAWALGTGTFSRSSNLGSLQNYDNDAGGLLVGADYRWNENFVTGLYGGYDYSHAEYNGGGSTKGDSFSFGTYASYAKEGYYADAVIGGGYTEFQTQRSIDFSTIDRTASADPNSDQFTAGLNLGKDFEIGKFTLGPIAGAQYTYAGIDSFTESGAESLDLSLGQQNANSLQSMLGGRIAYTWSVNQKITLIPEVRMFWQHEFLNNARTVDASLDGGSGAAFDYETSDPYRDSVFAGAGVTAQFGKNLSGSVFYNINFGSQSYQSNMVSAGLNLSF